MQKIDDDEYALPDWYGREVTPEWEKNREQHNKRVCYEVSRILAKSISELFKDDNNFNVCILWDKELTHYYVGLTCDDYTITLDLDDFYNIKDLTRIKTGLTADGIVVLEDEKGKFDTALRNFNHDRSKYAIKKIVGEIEDKERKEGQMSITDESDEIIFVRNAIEILRDDFNIDSQGLFEYMKEILDIKLGPDSRKKVWKKIEGKASDERRYTRCLVFDVDNEKYIIDSDEKNLRAFDESEFAKENPDFIPYKDVSRDWENEPYNGI
ncbi:MAG: hypothetical protein HFJ17_01790 [Clostridia bacterium]|nr:hypothetical protein [Clostridia bacterium]